MPAADVAQTQRAPQTAVQSGPTVFGGRNYSDVIGEMNALLGVQPDAARIADATVLSSGSVKEVTFSVPTSNETPTFRVVHYDDVSRANYDRKLQTAGITEPVRFGEYEVTLERRDGRDVYTVRTTSSFIGALKIESPEGSLTVYSHGAAPETTQVAASLPPTPLDDSRLPSSTFDQPFTRTERRRTETPAESRPARPVERSERPAPESVTPDFRTPESMLPPEIEMPRPQISLAGLDSTPIERHPTESPADIELPASASRGASPEPEPEPARSRSPFQRTQLPEREPDPEPIERPSWNLPRRERTEFTLDSRPVASLPSAPQIDTPTLAMSGPAEIEIRLAPNAPATDFPLPEEFAEPEFRPEAPRSGNMRRTERREQTPEQPREEPPTREQLPRSDLPDPFELRLGDLPLPETPADVPQLAVISSPESDIRRSPAPGEPIEHELGEPDERAERETAQQSRQQQRPARREPSPLDREIEDVQQRLARAEQEREALARRLQGELESHLPERERNNRFGAFQNFLNQDDMSLPTEQWADQVLRATGNDTAFESILGLFDRSTRDKTMPDFQRYRMLRHNIGELGRTNTRLQGLRTGQNQPTAEPAQGAPSSR